MYKNLSEIEMRVYRRASEEMNRKAKRNEDKKTGEREREIFHPYPRRAPYCQYCCCCLPW
jgi:hypothetical protein